MGILKKMAVLTKCKMVVSIDFDLIHAPYMIILDSFQSVPASNENPLRKTEEPYGPTNGRVLF